MDNQILWFGIAAVLIGGIVRALKEDSPLPSWLHVSKDHRRALAVGLGIVSAGVDMMATGAHWKDALASGIASALLAIGGHHAIVDRLLGGKEPFARAPDDSGKIPDMDRDTSGGREP